MSDLFSRVPTSYRPVIEAAFAALPPHVEELCRPRFMCDVSPSFVGLHYQDPATYDRLAHCAWSMHACDRKTTVVLPNQKSVDVVIHELGHVFHEAVGFHVDVPETTRYSRTNKWERVAEAFELLLTPDYAWRGKWLDYLSAERFRPFRELVLG